MLSNMAVWDAAYHYINLKTLISTILILKTSTGHLLLFVLY